MLKLQLAQVQHSAGSAAFGALKQCDMALRYDENFLDVLTRGVRGLQNTHSKHATVGVGDGWQTAGANRNGSSNCQLLKADFHVTERQIHPGQ